jgi:hypothetical protein
VTTPSRTTSPLAHPAAGDYPTGFAGFARAWDGAAWAGPALTSPDAPDLRPKHPFLGVFTRASLWSAVVGILLGAVCTRIGAALDSTIWLLLAGFFACGGPLLAIVLAARRRLRIGSLRTPIATVLGIVSGLLATGIALVLESPTASVSLEAGYALAGPVEEFAKLLVPFLLLLVGPRVFRDPRIGVWTVIVSGAVFGVIEGIEYVGQLQLRATAITTLPFTDDSATVYDDSLLLLLSRPWVELGHVVWTTGAGVLIWLTAHRIGRRWTLLGLVGYLIAAAIHSFNDAVLSGLGIWGGPAGATLLIVTYIFWYRRSVRGLVPPDAIGTVPGRWRPTLSKRMRAAAAPGAAGATATTGGETAAAEGTSSSTRGAVTAGDASGAGNTPTAAG